MTQQNAAPRGPDAFKRLARIRSQRSPDLLALGPKRDPFYAGTKAHRRNAEWFAEQWERFKGSGGHVRRLHYRMLEQGVTRPDTGARYENDKLSWALLGDAAAVARHLGLVDPLDFIDRRNGQIRTYAPERDFNPEPAWQREEDWWTTPRISIPDWGSPRIEHPECSGYDYDPADQPVQLEIWVEKSGVDDILDPLCRELGVNFLSGTGYQSITHDVAVLRRAHKPVRILYVSDYDDAGKNMPVSTARQIEFYRDRLCPSADVMIDQIVLTREQVERFHLPHAPDDDRVELDALEALHPGALRDICRRAIKEWRDNSLAARLRQAKRDATDRLENAWADAVAPQQERLVELGRQADQIREQFAPRIAELRKDLAETVRPLEEQYAEIAEQVSEAERELEIDLPARPRGEVPSVDTSGWLFDTSRDYFTQLRFYKRHKSKS